MKQIFESPYYIDEQGIVYTHKLKVKQTYLSNSGYKYVVLRINGKNKCYYNHRLVALHYLLNPNNYPQVNHIDGNKLNNNLDNLEWCNNSMNSIHAFKNKLRTAPKHLYKKGEDGSNSKLTEQQVREIKSKLQQKYKMVDLCKEYKVHINTIKRIKGNITWSHITI